MRSDTGIGSANVVAPSEPTSAGWNARAARPPSSRNSRKKFRTTRLRHAGNAAGSSASRAVVAATSSVGAVVRSAIQSTRSRGGGRSDAGLLAATRCSEAAATTPSRAGTNTIRDGATGPFGGAHASEPGMAWGSSSTLPRRALFVVGVASGIAVSGEGSAQSATGGDGVTLAAPPTAGENAAYPGHRAPLAPDPLIKLPVGAVKPRGWLEQQLQLMASGMFGRIPEVSRWVRPIGSAWRSRDGSGDPGWEELPYWLKGFTSLAHLVKDNDRALVSSASGWIEAILAAQRDDGYFGPESNRALPDLWPNMPVLWALRTHFEATGDARVLEFLKRYFRYELALPRERLLPDSWQKVRGGDNLEIVHWLYDQTGEAC